MMNDIADKLWVKQTIERMREGYRNEYHRRIQTLVRWHEGLQLNLMRAGIDQSFANFCSFFYRDIQLDKYTDEMAESIIVAYIEFRLSGGES